MNCKTCRVEIEESEGGQPLSQSASAHLESCPHCFAFREERLALSQMIGSLEVVTAPADFDFRLRARLAALKGQEPGRVAWNRFAPGGWSLTLAASFVILVALGVVIRQFRVAPRVDSGTPGISKIYPNNTPVPTPLLPQSRPTGNKDIDVAQSSKVPRSAEMVSQPRTNSTIGSDANPRAIVSNVKPNEGGGSVDSSVSTAANVLPLGISDPTLRPSVVAVPVRASMQATTITLNDGSATPQTISIRPVTFGGQDVFEQPSAKWMFVPTVQGIW